MQFWTMEELPEALGIEGACGEEIAPGVRIERRAVLRLGAQLAALAAVGGLVGCAPRPSEKGTATAAPPAPTADPQPLRVGDFVRQVRPQARALIEASAPDEEAYLRAAGDLLAQLESVDSWRKPREGQPYSMDTTAYVPPIVLFRIKMEPGAVISLHDHRHYNGVIVCTEGSVRGRYFDIVPDAGQPLDIAAGEVPPKGSDFVIRQTHDEVIRQGGRSSLTRARDNIHEVTAGEDGCTLMDLFTHFRPEARSYGITWDDTPFDAEKQLYRVAWA
jgi:hypothetical protein